MNETSPSGDVEDESVSASPRHDHKPTNVAPKRRGRPPKVRHDSPTDLPINGWGAPFDVKFSPGWSGSWVSAHDMAAMSFRPWEVATWGDPRVLQYQGAARGGKGAPIKYRELTLMLMTTAHAVAIRNNDERRARHSQLRSELKSEALDSGDGRQRGRFKESQL